MFLISQDLVVLFAHLALCLFPATQDPSTRCPRFIGSGACGVIWGISKEGGAGGEFMNERGLGLRALVTMK